jgi:aspartate/methionine/tyrosine aminotransferase
MMGEFLTNRSLSRDKHRQGRLDQAPMTYHINKLLAAVAVPPIAEAQGWIKGREFPTDKPLIDVAQAVPGYPPPAELTDHLARIVGEPASARYTDIEGLPSLRKALAADMSAFYGASIDAADTLIAAGCNQAFCIAVMAREGHGDEIILPLPYYFNHQMWLDMQGLRAVHLPFRPDRGGVPDPAEAEALIGPRTRAILLVTPNNPTGAIYPPAVIKAFYDLARRRGLALLLDETYRDFLPTDGAPHGLFVEPGWRDTLVQLYSFSKVYCLTGYRVGSIIAGPALLGEIAKAMDTIAICAPRLGQLAALYGLEHLKRWRTGNTAMMRERLQTLVKALRPKDSGTNAFKWELISAGAYFAYLRHPFKGRTASEVAQALAASHNILALPGSMFGPGQEDFLRFAFANVPAETMPEIGQRLAQSAPS